MALAAQYYTWRTTANPDCLSKDAALHYVTTLVTHKTAPVIGKHVNAQAKQLKKKKEEVLSSTESMTALCEEIHTVLEFTNSGGAYLPGLDDNLVVDQTVTLPIVHVVQFDTDGRIEQIRQHWDQAALLKALGVIGVRGSNWPISDSEHQAKLVKESSADTADALEPKRKDTLEETTKDMGGVSLTSRPIQKVNPTNDPHTSLDFAAMGQESTPVKAGSPAKGSVAPKTGAGRNYTQNRLFDTDDNDQNTPQSAMTTRATRATSKPQERDWGELFAGGGDSNQATPKASENTASPTKGARVAPKIGAGKNYAPNRLFEMQAEDEEAIKNSPSKDRTYIKPHATKFQHFDFYDGHDEEVKPSTKPVERTKHMSQWDFEDFSTPAKPTKPPPSRGQAQGAHHFSFDDDTKEDSPMKKAVPKPRRDADTHFELQDDGGDVEQSMSSSAQGGGARQGASTRHNRNQSSLWQSQTDDGGPEEAGARSYNQSTVVSGKDRSNTFGAHWAMDDEHAGAVDESHDASSSRRQGGVGASIKDRSKDFDAHWAIDDENPGAVDDSHDASRNRGTSLSSNKAKVLQTLTPHWEARDDSDSSAPAPAPASTSGPTATKSSRQAPSARNSTNSDDDDDDEYDPFPRGKENQPQRQQQQRGIRTTGDGTGGRKGTTRQWGFGDDEGDGPAKPNVGFGKGARRPPGGHSTAAFWERDE